VAQIMKRAAASGARYDVRAREVLAAKRAQGVRLGHRSVLSGEVVARIVDAHRAGAGWSAIARQLKVQGVSTAHGGSLQDAPITAGGGA